jgi:hypothetical protein
VQPALRGVVRAGRILDECNTIDRDGRDGAVLLFDLSHRVRAGAAAVSPPRRRRG